MQTTQKHEKTDSLIECATFENKDVLFINIHTHKFVLLDSEGENLVHDVDKIGTRLLNPTPEPFYLYSRGDKHFYFDKESSEEFTLQKYVADEAMNAGTFWEYNEHSNKASLVLYNARNNKKMTQNSINLPPKMHAKTTIGNVTSIELQAP